MSDSISTSLILKHCGYAVAGIAGAISYVGLEPKAIYVLGILMGIDTLTGITKAVIVHGAKSYRTLKLIAGVVTKLMILSVPFILATAGHGVGVELTFIASMSVTILILAETSSILGNIHSVAKKKETAEFDAIALIYGIFRGFLERYLESIKTNKK